MEQEIKYPCTHCGKPMLVIYDREADVNRDTITPYYQLTCVRCHARHSRHETREKMELAYLTLLLNKSKRLGNLIDKLEFAESLYQSKKITKLLKGIINEIRRY